MNTSEIKLDVSVQVTVGGNIDLLTDSYILHCFGDGHLTETNRELFKNAICSMTGQDGDYAYRNVVFVEDTSGDTPSETSIDTTQENVKTLYNSIIGFESVFGITPEIRVYSDIDGIMKDMKLDISAEAIKEKYEALFEKGESR